LKNSSTVYNSLKASEKDINFSNVTAVNVTEVHTTNSSGGSTNGTTNDTNTINITATTFYEIQDVKVELLAEDLISSNPAKHYLKNSGYNIAFFWTGGAYDLTIFEIEFYKVDQTQGTFEFVGGKHCSVSDFPSEISSEISNYGIENWI